MESRLNKIDIVLLPRYFKKIGLTIIILAFATALFIKFMNVEMLQSKKELFKIYFLNAFILGLFFIGFSKNKIEDEITISLRLKAMAFSFALNVIVVIISPVIYILFKDPVQNETAQKTVMNMLFVYLIIFYLSKKRQ